MQAKEWIAIEQRHDSNQSERELAAGGGWQGTLF